MKLYIWWITDYWLEWKPNEKEQESKLEESALNTRFAGKILEKKIVEVFQKRLENTQVHLKKKIKYIPDANVKPIVFKNETI